MDAVAGLAFNPESLRPIASGQHPSLITKHNQSPVILLDAGLLDRSRNLEVGVPIKDLAITALLSDLGPERGLVRLRSICSAPITAKATCREAIREPPARRQRPRSKRRSHLWRSYDLPACTPLKLEHDPKGDRDLGNHPAHPPRPGVESGRLGKRA